MASACALTTCSYYPPLPPTFLSSPSFLFSHPPFPNSHFSPNLRTKRSFIRKNGHGQQRSLFSVPKASYKGKQAGEEEQGEDISKATLIWRAIKLPIYSVALVPLTVGSAAAYLQTGLFNAKRYFVLLLSSVLIITWLNLSNDAYDFETGADKKKKESVVNLVGSHTVTLFAANTSLALGFIGLLWASAEAGDVRSIYLLTCAILCGYVYQCPPFRLSYLGLGEPLCFAAFGPFATPAFYFLQSSKRLSSLRLTGTVLSASLLVGLTTSLILFCSHFHQLRLMETEQLERCLLWSGSAQKGAMRW